MLLLSTGWDNSKHGVLTLEVLKSCVSEDAE